jgi:hypothetical protein
MVADTAIPFAITKLWELEALIRKRLERREKIDP